jgi:hypothetical protein
MTHTIHCSAPHCGQPAIATIHARHPTGIPRTTAVTCAHHYPTEMAAARRLTSSEPTATPIGEAALPQLPTPDQQLDLFGDDA